MSELSARNGLNTAEILFGGYHSARERGRVDFPLEVEDNAFVDLVERWALAYRPADESAANAPGTDEG